jgi:hypothetical protein
MSIRLAPGDLELCRLAAAAEHAEEQYLLAVANSQENDMLLSITIHGPKARVLADLAERYKAAQSVQPDVLPLLTAYSEYVESLPDGATLSGSLYASVSYTVPEAAGHRPVGA